MGWSLVLFPSRPLLIRRGRRPVAFCAGTLCAGTGEIFCISRVRKQSQAWRREHSWMTRGIFQTQVPGGLQTCPSMFTKLPFLLKSTFASLLHNEGQSGMADFVQNPRDKWGSFLKPQSLTLKSIASHPKLLYPVPEADITNQCQSIQLHCSHPAGSHKYVIRIILGTEAVRTLLPLELGKQWTPQRKTWSTRMHGVRL